MPYRFKIVAGLVGAAVAYTAVTYPLRRKYLVLEQEIAMLDESHDALYETNDYLMKQTKYLASLLDKHNVTVDDFDMIVLSNPDLLQD